MSVMRDIFMNGDWWTVLGGISSAGLAAVIWLAVWRGRAMNRVWAAIWAAGILAGVAGTVAFASHPRDVLVLEAGVVLQVSPFEGAEAKGVLDPGETVRYERAHGDYVYVRTASGGGGWVNDGDLSSPLWSWFPAG